MADVRQQLLSLEQKYKRFKQQQFIFINALERSREHARDRTEPVSTIKQVQKYMNHHCSSSTDRSIFLLFLEIISDLEGVLKQLESSVSSRNTSCEGLETCKELLNPSSNISQQRAHYPHNVINRLSCDEARNFYGGIVSIIPLTLDLLAAYIRGSAKRLSSASTVTPNQTLTKNVGTGIDASLEKDTSKHQRSKSSEKKKGSGGWHAGKPAWKPPGNTRR
ncbi:sperm acrosome-associated protein 9 [Danio rerio]|uniref:Sperm acrosome-associated protein 9 n=1 Tax=Danio rerio TaxID=7955 RepID=Q0P3W8_DANRE|nr:sperm acrosome-associated protein 9 [Danio rerio]AAI22407.1 Zgc:153740 [Danio rerio]|eukprot:NP_001038895.1 sperm acrosome-associated protein 9 [Danio rerio]